MDRPPGSGSQGPGVAAPAEVVAAEPAPTGAGTGPRVLILYSDTGGGHRAAARSVEQALLELDPTTRITIADPLIGEGPGLVRRLASLYSPLIQRSRPAWGLVFYGGNTRPAFAVIRALFGRNVRRVVAETLARDDPDLVLSVHPLLNHVSHRAIAHSGRPRPMMVVITDLVRFHRGWADPRADVTVVPTELARQACLRWGVPASRLLLLGLPVDRRFRPAAPGEQAALRRRFRLAEDRMTILVSGGGEGSGNLLRSVRALAWHDHPWQLIVVCGRNEKLRRRLSRLRFATPTAILGFVDNMPDLMRASDVVVSKAGPGAIAEALATGLPIILTGYLPGQETENVTFVEMTGVGLYAPKADQLLESTELLFADGARIWREMAQRTSEVARPYAALDIAREALSLAAAGAAQR